MMIQISFKLSKL